MGLWEVALAIFGGLILYCLLLPAGAGMLMYKGLQRAAVEKAPFNLCLKVAFAATYAACFLMFVLGFLRLVPDTNSMEGRLIWGATLLSMQLVLVVVLMRNYSAKALAIEIGSFLLVFAVVFGINLLLNPVRPVPME
jgi:hypothetical protein